MSKSNPLLSVIILNWNTAVLLHACLTSLQSHLTLPHEIIVVDNGSSDESVSMVRAEFPTVQVIALPENRGFAQGNNAGLAVAQGEYLLLLNPDTEVRAGGIEGLVTFMAANPTVGIAGPTLWNPDGSWQRSTAALPTLWQEFLVQTMLFKVGHTAVVKTNPIPQTNPVGMVTGAALAIRRACYEQIGDLDPRIFMFYEDTDWCQRAHAARWEVWFVATAGIIHHKAAASSRFARTRTLLASQRSTLYYFAKHHGQQTRYPLRLITLLGSSLRLLRAGLLWLLNQQRADQRTRGHAYRRMWLWAVTGNDDWLNWPSA
jgi:N-acetylglucosaminyl-diphospho-decaprenol L-rhamnosyltransferase